MLTHKRFIFFKILLDNNFDYSPATENQKKKLIRISLILIIQIRRDERVDYFLKLKQKIKNECRLYFKNDNVMK